MQTHIIQNLFENAQDAFIVVKIDGTIKFCNKAASLMFGYQHQQFIDQQIHDFIPDYASLKARLHESSDLTLKAIGIRNGGLDFPVKLKLHTLNHQGLTGVVIGDATEKKTPSEYSSQEISEFQSLFEVLPACFLRLDPNEIILDYHIGQVSSICAEKLPLLGARLPDLFNEATATAFHNAIEHTKASNQAQSFEYSVSQHAIQTTFLATIKPSIHEQVIAIIQDITNYKQAEKSLLNYHTLADILPVGIFRCDLLGNYIYHNEFWKELTGDKTAQFSNWLESLHDEDKERIAAIWEQITHEHVPFNTEFRFMTPHAKTIYVQCRAVPEVDELGNVNGYIGIAHNITETILANSEIRKSWLELESKVEERTADLRAKNRWLQQTINERKQVEHTLSEERNFISAVLDTAGAIIMVCDSQGRIVRINRSHNALIGYSEEELRGKHFIEYLVEDSEIERTMQMFNQLKNNKQRLAYEGICKTKHATNKLIAWSNTVILNKQNAVDYIVFTGIDITEQRQAEEDARQHHADLIHVSRLSTMGEMATGLAHELNQPLAAIVNYTQGSVRLLNRIDNPIKADLTHALRQVTAQAERAGEIIRKLREFVNKGESHHSKIKLEKIVRASLNFASADIKKHAATVRLRLKEHLPEINADAIQIEQVLLNLIRNGLEAMSSIPTKEKELIVRVFINDSGHLQVTVIDQGHGLPPNLEENKVFDAFFTTKSDGMGMGLAISRSIIEAHNGCMWVTRNSAKGCSFHFSLPVP